MDLACVEGSVHALLGKNGAGKSTLIKILTGAEQPDAGEIRLNGVPIRLRSTREARERGIAAVYQELSLVPELTVAENLFLGALPRKAAAVDWSALVRRARHALAWLPEPPDPHARVAELTVAARQLVEITRAVAMHSRVLILDEPTAALGPHEVERLFAVIRSLRARGVAVVYISHRLDEVEAIADRVTVLRDGVRVYAGDVSEVSREALIAHMVGRDEPPEGRGRRATASRTHPAGQADAPPLLLARGITSLDASGRPLFRDVSFVLAPGEILGLTGPVGSGASAVARALFGLVPLSAGAMELAGQPFAPRSPREALQRGVAFVSDDRAGEGVVPEAPVAHNVSVAVLPRVTVRGFLDLRAERALAARRIEQAGVTPADPDQPAGTLSGGNQQKVVLARWMEHGARVLVLCEPTRGMDVAAKEDVHRLLRRLRDEGAAILVVSSEYEEIADLADRALVMSAGEVAGEVRGRVTAGDLLALASRALPEEVRA